MGYYKFEGLEINMHHLRGNAIQAGPLSDFEEIFASLVNS